MANKDYDVWMEQNRLRRELARQLRAEGKTLQTIANVLNISRQRVHQLLNTQEQPAPEPVKTEEI